MLSSKVADLLEEPAMIIMSTETAAQWPAIGCCVDARVIGPKFFDVVFSGCRFPDIRDDVANGCRMAVALVSLRDCATYHIKGAARAVRIHAIDARRVELYRRRVSAFLSAAGVRHASVDHWIGGSALFRVRLTVSEVDDRTP